ncbi:MAG: hypothetical protein ACYDAK_02955 [Candidatus Limnocylindrales bacterium]
MNQADFDEPRFSRAHMLRDAAALIGQQVTSRRLTDWVELGIVPAPIKRGLGRGRGITSGWSAFGHDFWLDMLRKRGQGEDIAGLTNYVLGLWVYYRVPVEASQVRRALHTWATRRSRSRTGHLTKSATIAVERYIHPGSKAADRRRLIRLLGSVPRVAAPETSIGPVVLAVVAPGQASRRGTTSRRGAANLSVELIAQVIGTRRLAAVSWDRAVAPELDALRTMVPHATERETEAEEGLISYRLGVCRDIAEGLGLFSVRALGVLAGV